MRLNSAETLLTEGQDRLSLSAARKSERFLFWFRAVTVTFLAVGAATLALGVPEALANNWILPPTDLSTAGQDTEHPQIAIAPDGTTTVVWRRLSDGITQASTRPAGSSTFGAIQPLSDAELFSSGPQVAVAPDGETTVVWGQIVGGSGFTIQARIRPAGSDTFGTVQTLATNQGTGVSGAPQMAVAPDGETTVTWVDGSNTVQAATRPAGSSTFGTVAPLSAVGENASIPKVAVAPDGTTTVVWNLTFACSPGPTCYVVQARTRPAGSNTFGPVQDVSPSSGGSLSPNLAVAADGATTVVWTRRVGSDLTAQNATLPAGSNTFGTVQDVSPTDPSIGFANLAVAPDGAATVVWSQFLGGTLTIRARTRPAGSSTFGTIEDISEVSNQSTIHVAAAPDGAITVVWEWEDVAMGGVHTAQAASRAAGASAFWTITNLSAAGASPTSSRLDVALNGAITAVWAQSVAGLNSIQAASSDPTTYSLAVQLAGEGKGSVASSPSGIECGSTCQTLFNLGTNVTLTATAASGSTFTGWGGPCSGTASTCSVTLDAAKSVTATFTGTPGPDPVTPPKLDLKIDASRASLRAGQNLRLRLSVSNSGQETAKNTSLCLRIPGSFSLASATKPYNLRSGNLVCWKRGNLAGVGVTAGESKSVQATLRVSRRARARALSLLATVAAKNAANGQPVKSTTKTVIRVKA